MLILSDVLRRLLQVEEELQDVRKDRDKLLLQLDQADEIVLEIHAQITTFSKYTASKVYEWKDIRGEDGSIYIKQFDDNGRDE